jgi:transcription elongation GreA/GreB family factor
MGAKVGEIVSFEAPKGTFQFEILEISLDEE